MVDNNLQNLPKDWGVIHDNRDFGMFCCDPGPYNADFQVYYSDLHLGPGGLLLE